PTDITKTAAYVVTRTVDITKTAQYTVVTTPTDITKTAQYTVITTPTDITKTAAYVVTRTVDITKTAQYTVVTTPTDITKTAAYVVAVSSTDINITKTAQYIVSALATDITKSAQYLVASTNRHRNLFKNPSFEVNQSGWGWNSVNVSQSRPTDTPQSGLYYSRTTITTGFTATNLGWYPDAIPARPGEVLYVSYMFRSNVATTFGITFENDGVGGNIYSTPVTVTPNVWTKIEGFATVPANATFIKPCLYGRNTISYQIGDTLDFDSTMAEKSSVAVNYADGSYAGWAWAGTANFSESIQTHLLLNSSYYVATTPTDITKSASYNVQLLSTDITKSAQYLVASTNRRMNLLLNPDFAGSGSYASGYIYYANGTSAGSASVSGGLQTITATTLAGGSRRFGLIRYGTMANILFSTTDVITLRVKVDTSGLAAGTVAFAYFEEYTGGTTIAYPEASVSNGATSITVSRPSRGVSGDRIGTVLFGVKHPTADWTGTTTAIFSEAIFTVTAPGEAVPTYYDGNDAGYQWIGTPNASFSQQTHLVKSATYATFTSTDVTKSATYAVALSVDVTKPSEYRVATSQDIIFAAEYSVTRFRLVTKKVLVLGVWTSKPVKVLVNGVWVTKVVRIRLSSQ
ncbi:MAG: hypothetical protein WCJ60_03480, partial [bacterium]